MFRKNPAASGKRIRHDPRIPRHGFGPHLMRDIALDGWSEQPQRPSVTFR